MHDRTSDAYTPSIISPLPMRCKMVGWYDPTQLARTAVEVFLSTVFGRHADHRLQEALAAPDGDIFDYSRCADSQPFWLDYVADVGDGWNSTYAVAYHLAQPNLRVSGHETRRGSVLIFGGDEVYPTASRKAYK